jgi:hypothetical protein
MHIDEIVNIPMSAFLNGNRKIEINHSFPTMCQSSSMTRGVTPVAVMCRCMAALKLCFWGESAGAIVPQLAAPS